MDASQAPTPSKGSQPETESAAYAAGESALFAEPIDAPQTLHRGFKTRQVNMLAIAGAIGTGLIVGSGTGLSRGGPASLLIAYTITGSIIYFVMTALGEMAAFLPSDQGFNGYATRFVDPALGFATGWNYFFKYAVVLPNNLTAAGLIIQYWRPDLTYIYLFIKKLMIVTHTYQLAIGREGGRNDSRVHYIVKDLAQYSRQYKLTAEMRWRLARYFRLAPFANTSPGKEDTTLAGNINEPSISDAAEIPISGLGVHVPGVQEPSSSAIDGILESINYDDIWSGGFQDWFLLQGVNGF